MSACFSLWAGDVFVEAGVKHVICIKQSSKIRDIAALRFTKAFYTSLAEGYSVQAAFDIAKRGVEAQPDLAVWGLSVCLRC